MQSFQKTVRSRKTNAVIVEAWLASDADASVNQSQRGDAIIGTPPGASPAPTKAGAHID
jgi:hypothetical protein